MSKLSYPEMCIDDVLVFGIELTLMYTPIIINYERIIMTKYNGIDKDQVARLATELRGGGAELGQIMMISDQIRS